MNQRLRTMSLRRAAWHRCALALVVDFPEERSHVVALRIEHPDKESPPVVALEEDHPFPADHVPVPRVDAVKRAPRRPGHRDVGEQLRLLDYGIDKAPRRHRACELGLDAADGGFEVIHRRGRPCELHLSLRCEALGKDASDLLGCESPALAINAFAVVQLGEEGFLGLIALVIGDVLDDIAPATVLRENAKMRKTGMSSNALHKTHQKLSQMMKQAVREEIILRNPCDPIDDVKRPEAAERRSLSAKQAVQLAMDLKECERSGRIVAVWLALATGVRRGEALGLVWGNVDLTRKRIRIEKQLDSKGVRRDPKSHKSKRNLAIDDGTVAFLTEWKAMQSDLFYRGGDAPDGAPVCSNDTDGGFISPAAFDKWRRTWFFDHGLGTFEKVETWHDRNGVKRYRRSGYRGYNLHELRHTQATLLIGSGADILTLQLPSLKGLASH